MTRASSVAVAAFVVLGLAGVAVLMHMPRAGVDRRSVAGAQPVATASADSLTRGPFGDAVRVGRLQRADLDEASGLAASRRQADLLWIHNDSGSVPRLFAVGPDGRDRGVVRVPGVSNVDWEDLASFELDGTPYLLVADVGDNAARRSSVRLHVVEEPELFGERFDERATARVAWSLEVVYEDGPLDCEGVAVDVQGERILLVSKRTVPLRLYEVPLRPGPSKTGSPVVATRLAQIAGIPQPTAADLEEDPQFGASRTQATALDISPDGRELLVVTYRHAYRFPRAHGETWPQAVARPPEIIVLPRMAQTEAGAYSHDGRAVWVTSEQRPAPLFRLDRLQ